MSTHTVPTWPSEGAVFDEVDAIEAKAEPTTADLERLGVLARHPSSLAAMMARSAAGGVRAKLAKPSSASQSEQTDGAEDESSGKAGRRRPEVAPGSDGSLAEPCRAEAEREGAKVLATVARTPIALDLAEGVVDLPPAEDPAPSGLPSTSDQPITLLATHVANDVTGLDTMAGGKFVSYLRVSTDRQGRSGLGLDAQRGAVADFLAGGRWSLVREFVEVESGKRADRPQLAEAMALCRVHGATLVIAKLDRLSRDAHFLLGLEKAGVDFVAADMPTANRLTVGIMAMVADEERRMISARTKAALAVAKARGTKLGGDRGNFALIAARGRAAGVVARQARASARTADLAPIIAGLQAEGVTSLARLAAALTERGIPTSRGADRWSPMQVSRVLKASGGGT